jgi:predicted naringenin-chalcone synthase
MIPAEHDSSKGVYLHGIETAVPEKWYSQDFALEFFLKNDGLSEREQTFLRKIYAGSAIEKRHTVIDDYDKEPSDYSFYPPNRELSPSPGTEKRNDIFIREANALSLEASTGLLEGFPHIRPSEITHLITVSCTGFSAPGFDIHLVKELGLSRSARRYHLGFMGCYAALTGLSLAWEICRSQPDAKVLLVNVELCSIHLQQKKDLDSLVANAIFADGASAALITGNPDDATGKHLALDSFHSQFLHDSEDDMAWKIGNTGFDMKLSAYVPRIINKNIHDVLGNLLAKSDLRQEEIDIWAIHPGGKAILQKVETALGIAPSELQPSYDVLREYGNMSSTTIMFVLRRILEDSRFGTMLGLAFGPGLTVETGIFRKLRKTRKARNAEEARYELAEPEKE